MLVWNASKAEGLNKSEKFGRLKLTPQTVQSTHILVQRAAAVSYS